MIPEPTVPRRQRAWKPGRVQEQVLVSLSAATHGPKSVRQLTRDWPGLDESGVRSAINSLGYRGLVEPIRWEGRSRLFGLTNAGEAVVKTLDVDAIEDQS